MKERKNDEKNNISTLSINSNQLSNQYQLESTINYVTDGVYVNKSSGVPHYTSDTTGLVAYERDENNVTLPIFFGEKRTIQIPKGVKRRVKRLPKRVLRKIDSNIEEAIEKCFILISTLAYTVFYNEDESYNWKNLSSTLMNDLFKKGGDNTYVYKNVINALTYSTNSTMPIIECKKNHSGEDSYQEGNYSKQYRLHLSSRNQTLIKYTIQFKENIKKRREKHLKDFSQANTNIIGKNLIGVYPLITLPEKKDIENQGKKLAKEGYKTKKGKLLTYLNKKSKSYYPNPKVRSFVEENLKQYNYLVGVDYIIPKVGDYKSGGRVVDSFNLMPSWIRKLVKIDGEKIIELDFKALHPNIAMNLYGGAKCQITHKEVAKVLKMPLKEVKIEHLSFFNKRVQDLKRSPLYKYYSERDKGMLDNLINDKIINKNYKITSQKLFKKEVEIMTSIIEKLNSICIYVLYVYDALYCKESDKNIVSEIMNRVIKEHGVNTNIG